MDLYHSTDTDGVTLLNPDAESMRALLERLDEPGADELDHPDASLVHDASGWSISVFPGGTVTLENLDARDGPPLFLNGVSREEALALWLQLSRGQIEALLKHPWLRDET